MSLKRVDYMRSGKQHHRYELDGERVPGVTSILSEALPKPALLPWGIRSVAEYAARNLDALNTMRDSGMGEAAIVSALKQSPYTERDAAAKRGTEVHALAEQLIHGREVDVPAELAAHVDSYVRFLDDWKPTPVVTEAVVASRRWKYAGSLDLIADLPDGRRVIADVKTSKSVYGETALQCAAYAHAEVRLDESGTELPMVEGITHGYVIHVTGNGYSVHPIDIGEDTFKTFTHLCYVASKVRGIRDLIGPAEQVPA